MDQIKRIQTAEEDGGYSLKNPTEQIFSSKYL